MGRKRCSFYKISFSQCTIDLIGGNLKIFLAFLPSFHLWVIPSFLCPLEQVNRPHYIGLDKDFLVSNTAIHMIFCRKVDDIIEVVLFKQASNKLFITNIAFHKYMLKVTLNFFQVFNVSGIG